MTVIIQRIVYKFFFFFKSADFTSDGVTKICIL